MSIHDYPSIFSRLRGLTAAQRAEVFQLAEQRWCWHCGGPQGACECGWPKVEPEPKPAGIHVLDGPATPERVRAALKEHGAVVFSAEHEDDFGFDPAVIAGREREVKAGRFTPAKEFFARLRAAPPASPNPKEEP